MKKIAMLALLGMSTILSTAVLAEGVEPIEEVVEPGGNFDPAKYGKVAVVQWAPSAPTPVNVDKARAERFKQGNREVLARYIREAAANGAKMVITPEFSIVGYPDIPELPPEEDEFRNPQEIAPYVEKVPGPSTEYFGKLAKQLGVYIHIGFAEEIGGKYYNVAVALNPSGEIAAKYHKINLFEGETHFLEPGKNIATYDSPFGKIGFIICADVYSSNPMRLYKDKGVKVLALSTSWARWNSGMNAFKSGARGNNSYILAANQNYFPDSGVVNPDGTTQSHIRQSDGVAYGYLPYVKK